MIAATLFLALPLGPQANDAFRFENAPRWYNVSTFAGRPNPGAMACFDFDADGDEDAARATYNRVEIYLMEEGSFRLGSVLDTTMTGGFLTYDLARGHFDGDGIEDIAVFGKQQAFPYPGIFQVMLGDGAGGFTPQPKVDIGWQDILGAAVEAADLNQDGLTDLVLADLGRDEMKVVLTGTPGFTTLTPGGLVDIRNYALGDLNGDGFPDLATSTVNGQTSQIDVRLNDGSGGFPSGTLTTLGAVNPGDVVIGDADGDGFQDVVTSSADFVSPGTEVLVFRGDGSGTLAAPVVSNVLQDPWSSFEIDVVEFDGDGQPDLVMSFLQAEFGELSSLLITASGDGSGGFSLADSVSMLTGDIHLTAPSPLGTRSILTSAGHVVPLRDGGKMGAYELQAGGPVIETNVQAVLDFDRDGIDDIAVYDYTSQEVRVYLSDGEGGFSAPLVQVVPVVLPPLEMRVGHLNNDPWEDLLLVEASALWSVLNQSGAGMTIASTDLTPLTCSLEAKAIGFGDLNHDGLLDTIRGANHALDAILALCQPNGTFSLQCLSMDTPPNEYTIADMTGDGLADVIYTGASGLSQAITILAGTGTGGLLPPVHQSLSVYVSDDLVPVDWDEDGDLDLLIDTLDGMAVLDNDGFGNLSVGTHLFSSQAPFGDLHAVDMDRDGDLDVVARTQTSHAGVWVIENVGGGLTFPDVAWDFSSFGDWSKSNDLDVGDFDADGYVDVVAGGILADPTLPQPLVYFNRTSLHCEGLAQAGQTLEFTLDLPAAAGQPYLMLASRFGTYPGVPLPGETLPLNFDAPLWAASAGGGLFVGFLGTLDGQGRGSALVQIPPVLILPGDVPVDFAFGAIDPASPTLVKTSGSFGVLLR